MAKVAFRVHPKFVYDGIRRQAGSLCKAILEGVMNSVEAGATEVNITFAQNDGNATLDIVDNGTGIPTKRDIEKYFATFGQPHTADERKIWAQFRMGRGQLFSFGVNTWLTGTHKLIVDVEQWNVEDTGDDWNLDFEWLEKQPQVAGCNIHIELYKNPIGNGYHSEAAFQDAIRRQIEFVAVPVYFNGTLLTHDPADLDWDVEDEYAYYLWAKGSNLTVYNLGAFCKEIPASTAGVTGIVVSKQQLKVNFARNDIQHDCPIWKEINKVVWKNRVKRTRNKSRGYLSRHERISTLQDIRDGVQDYDDWRNISLLETSSGRALTFEFLRKLRSPWTFAPEGDDRADKIMQLDQAVCLNQDLLDDLGYSGEQKNFFDWLLRGQGVSFDEMKKFFRPFTGRDKGLADAFKRTTFIVSSDKWTKPEQRIIKVLERIGDWYGLWQGRHLTIGISDTYAAWTDGATFIAMDRDWLRRHATGYEEGVTKIFATLAHELAHDEDTAQTHVHGEEFYRRYHDLTMGRAKRGSSGLVSPLIGINHFRAEMKKIRIDEQYEQATAREEKERERREKKLGMKRQRKVAATEKEPVVKTVKRTKRANTKRKPAGRKVRRLRI